ncbi:MAG TPA: TetR/AcrR family transcriptional regulator [Ktedonobacterales bacterium]
MAATDRRVRRTQHLLARALVEMTLEKGYDAVTIRDITERADVGYATFFRHYHDKDGLLHDASDVVVSDLTELLRSPAVASEEHGMGTALFTYVREHQAICRLLLSSRGPVTLTHHVIESGAMRMMSYQPHSDGLIPDDLEAYLFVSSSVALIQWWLDRDMPYSADRMGAIYDEMIVRRGQHKA